MTHERGSFLEIQGYGDLFQVQGYESSHILFVLMVTFPGYGDLFRLVNNNPIYNFAFPSILALNKLLLII